MRFLTVPTILATASLTLAQYGDISDVKLLKPEDKVDQPSQKPPKDAIVLFDGKSLDGWVKARKDEPAAWKLLKDIGAMEVSGGGDIKTKDTFPGPFHLHVEFRVPYMPNAKGQGRGNSGVYTHGRYEVQILDSYGLKSDSHDCGGIYQIAKPLVNVCKAPTVWQSYDIDFTPPVCENGKKTAPGIITVRHNGTLIHDKVKLTLDNTTSGLGGDPCTPGPIMLQDHGNPVQYRNIWLLQK